ncbi:MAG: hypothetical protein Q9182_001992 [Xanthomendoza sp. 2 TL-2023]
MPTFLTNLLTSIFTPGPTPTLLTATNASFFALQLVLLLLLILTHSIHFIILSFLSAGLWYAINWFAAEVALAKQGDDNERGAEGENDDDDDDSGDGTETEGAEKEDMRRNTIPAQPDDHVTETGIRKRRSLGSSTGDASTDSEWDKVEEAETER